MNDQAMTPVNSTEEMTRKGRRMLLAIVAVFVLPFFVLPLIMSPDQMKKTNKGILIQPYVQFTDLQVRDFNNNPVSAVPDKKWTMLYVVPENCVASCVAARTNALYSMRQVRVSLQRDMDRVQQLLLFTTDPDSELSILLNKEFSVMIKMRANSESVDKQMTQASTAGNIYLMSPDGYIFIYYPPYENERESIIHADDIKADLKKSIKGSRL